MLPGSCPTTHQQQIRNFNSSMVNVSVHTINTVYEIPFLLHLLSTQYELENSKGLTKCTLCGIVLFKLSTFLVMFLQVPSIDSTCFPRMQGLQGIIFFSLVLILCIPTYLGVKGDQFFTDRIFFGDHFTYKLVYYNLYYMSNFTQNCPIIMQN